MGWLLTPNGGKKSKKTTKRSTSKTKRGASPKPWDPHRTMLAVKVLGTFLVLVTVCIGWRFGERALMQYASTKHHVDLTPTHVVLENAPQWMAEPIKEELKTFIAQHVTGDPLDGQSLRNTLRLLETNTPDYEICIWVRDVQQIRRLASGKIIVGANYREPVAVVEARDGYHLTDAQGVHLPGLYFRHQIDKLGLPLIVGVASAPPTRGETWPGLDVQAGLSLVQVISQQSFMHQVRAIDVSHRDNRGRMRLVLHTARGMIRWGLPPGDERTIEPDAQVKLDWLHRVAQANQGAIDAGGKIVDVYGATVQVSQPMIEDNQGITYTFGP